MRIDIALVKTKLCESRTKATNAIKQGLVFYNHQQITKPSFEVQNLENLSIQGNLCPYVSKGGLKLEKALQDFQIDLKNKYVLDIGSSTGGFTDCSLQHGAKHVVAVDVGTAQLADQLRKNPCVTVYEQTDFRTIENDKICMCTVAVSDVSFISVTKMLPKLIQMKQLEDLICLIKPQFECGKEIAQKYHGIIKKKEIHIEVLKHVLHTFQEHNFFPYHLTFSPIQGGSGNIEYLAHFRPQKGSFIPDIPQIVNQAFQNF